MSVVGAPFAIVAMAMTALVLATNTAICGGIETPYTVKASGIPVPDGAEPGQIRRITQPFGNWILICDENLKARSKVCNATQTIVSADGSVIFSWSLAATEDRKPIFILRTPPDLGTAGIISVAFSREQKSIAIPVRACDENICVATIAVGNGIRHAIAAGSKAVVSFDAGARVTIDAPLAGLAKAVSSID